MKNFRAFLAGVSGFPPSPSTTCYASDDDDLLAALGGFSGADGLAGDIQGFSGADGLAGIMGDLEGVVGDDEELGRRVRRAASRAGMSPAAMFQRMTNAIQRLRAGGGGPVLPAALPGQPAGAFQSSITVGTPARGERFSWMPFPASAFTSVSGTTIVLRTTSQRLLRTVRMVGVERRTNGAGPPATSSLLVTVNEVKIGQEVQPAATGAAGFDCFSPFAVGIPVQFDPIEVNVPVEVTCAISAAPAAGERVDFSVAFFGYSIK